MDEENDCCRALRASIQEKDAIIFALETELAAKEGINHPTYENEYRNLSKILLVQEDIESTLVNEVNRLRQVVRSQRGVIKALSPDFLIRTDSFEQGGIEVDSGRIHQSQIRNQECGSYSIRPTLLSQQRQEKSPVSSRTLHLSTTKQHCIPAVPRQTKLYLQRDGKSSSLLDASTTVEDENDDYENDNTNGLNSHELSQRPDHSPSRDSEKSPSRSVSFHTDHSLHSKPWTPTRGKEIIPDILDYGLRCLNRSIYVDPNKENRIHQEEEAKATHQRCVPPPPPPVLVRNSPKRGFTTLHPTTFSVEKKKIAWFHGSPTRISSSERKKKCEVKARGGDCAPSNISKALHLEVDRILAEISQTIAKD